MGNKLGPTGKYPRGKLHKDDLGELKLTIGVDEEKQVIVLDLGTPVKWLALDKETAKTILVALNKKIMELE